MEIVQKRHRQEEKDLQARVMQKKKSASKKTRKGVNDECAELERQLKERQAVELSAIDGGKDVEAKINGQSSLETSQVQYHEPEPPDVDNSVGSVSIRTVAVSENFPKKPNRQKARLARRAAEQEATAQAAEKEAAALPNLRDQERDSMREAYTSRSLREHEIRSDGHCLYAAVADQLQTLEIDLKPKVDIDMPTFPDIGKTPSADYRLTRQVAAAYICRHPDDFIPFLEEPLDSYVETIRETGEWGGHLEILALAKAYEVDINVLHGDGKVDKIECGSKGTPVQFWLAYYRHSFGLGEHYNSLRKAR